MTRIKKLDPAVQHADKKEQAALQKVSVAQGEVSLEQNKLTQLRQYRAEYCQRLEQMQSSHSVIELQEFNRFISQLDDTIRQQMGVIQLRQNELDRLRSLWHKTQISSKVIHQVVDNLHQQQLSIPIDIFLTCYLQFK